MDLINRWKMREETWLVCGSRNSLNYSDEVSEVLDGFLKKSRELFGQPDWKPMCIIEGECPCSADVYSKWWAEKNGIPVKPFPAENGDYLKRNIRMLNEKPNEVIAFWDGYSYGTCFTIARALAKGISVTISPRGPLRYGGDIV
jgi:hypothetical protein